MNLKIEKGNNKKVSDMKFKMKMEVKTVQAFKSHFFIRTVLFISSCISLA